MKRFWGILWLAALWMGCGGPGPLKVAVVQDPRHTPKTEAFLRGVRYALQEAQNPRVELLVLTPRELPGQLDRITVVLAGPLDLRDLRALLTLGEGHQRPVLVGANHTLDLTRFPHAWRIPLNSDYLANAAVFFAVKMLKKRRLAALGNPRDPEMQTMYTDLRRYLKVYRVPDTLALLTLDLLQNPRQLRRWIRRQRPEVLFCLLPPGHAPDALPELRKAGFRGAVIGFHEWRPDSPQGEVYGVTDYCAADPRIRDFVEKYTREAGAVPTLWDALGYDAMKVILAVARQMEAPSPEDFMARMRTVAVEGLTGTLEYGTSRDPIGKRPLIVQYTAEGVRVVARPAVSPYR